MDKQILLDGKLLSNKQAKLLSSMISANYTIAANGGGFNHPNPTVAEHYRLLRGMMMILNPHMSFTDIDPADTSKWRRYHVVAKSENSHPTAFPPPGPFWTEPVEGVKDQVYMVIYLPSTETIEQWWPNVEVKQVEHKDRIGYSVYPKPAWWQGE